MDDTQLHAALANERMLLAEQLDDAKRTLQELDDIIAKSKTFVFRYRGKEEYVEFDEYFIIIEELIVGTIKLWNGVEYPEGILLYIGSLDVDIWNEEDHQLLDE